MAWLPCIAAKCSGVRLRVSVLSNCAPAFISACNILCLFFITTSCISVWFFLFCRAFNKAPFSAKSFIAARSLFRTAICSGVSPLLFFRFNSWLNRDFLRSVPSVTNCSPVVVRRFIASRSPMLVARCSDVSSFFLVTFSARASGASVVFWESVTVRLWTVACTPLLEIGHFFVL